MITYKEKVLNYYKERQKQGLKWVHFSLNYKAADFPEEQLYEEIWRMINAVDCPDREVLGRYSL